MIEFVHNPEIQLFTEFIKEFGSEPALQQISEKIPVVVPGDTLGDIFYKEDAFAYNSKNFWLELYFHISLHLKKVAHVPEILSRGINRNNNLNL